MLYTADSKPHLRICLTLALQQISFLGVYMVLSPLLARQLQLSHEQSLQLISATFMASGLGVIIQAAAFRGIGAGLLCPVQTTSSTFSALALSKASGGLTAIFGMVSIVGISQMLFAYLFQRFRSIFSVQIAGVAVTLIGLGLGFNGIKLCLEHSNQLGVIDHSDLGLFFMTLLPMIICNVWLSGYLRMISAFIGLATGLITAIWLGKISDSASLLLAEQTWFYLPHPMNIGWSLDSHSIIPGVITGLFLALHGFGALVAAQRFNDEHWKRPNLDQIRRGLLSEGLTNLISSALNGIPLTSSGGAVSLAAATGCTSRQVAYYLGGMMILIAFMPKVISFWELLPEPVIGGALLFLASYTTLAGLQIICSRLMDNRKTLTIGIALILGISYEPLKPLLHQTNIDGNALVIFTSVGLGVLVAVLLATVFRFRDHTLDSQSFKIDASELDTVVNFIEHQGKRWGARAELVKRAEYVTWQAFETIIEQAIFAHLLASEQRIQIKTKFNEYTFTVFINYPGPALPLDLGKPREEDVLLSDEAMVQMSAYLLKRLADQIKVSHSNGRSELSLTFND